MIKKKNKVDISRLSIAQISPRLQSIIGNPDLNDLKKADAQFDIELVPMFNLEADAIKIDLSISISLAKKNKQAMKVADFTYDFLYDYRGLRDLQDDEGVLNPEIFLTCANISYSTLRGIIYSKSANTCIENILMPILTGDELTRGVLQPR